VRANGILYEAGAALVQRRPRCDLYHAALRVQAGRDRYVIEMAPAWTEGGHGAVAEGPVGSRHLGRFVLFRYEIRCWLDGSIPDVDAAVDSPRRLSEDPALARRVVDLAPSVPRLVWGRDQLRTGDMWNSNSVVAWLLSRAGIDVADVHPPARGRAPGWKAGRTAADRTRERQ
jgi:hypothetical protein